MSVDRSSPPNVVEATVRGRPVLLIWEPGQATAVENPRPTNPYWVIEVGGTRYAGFPADPGDVDEAAVRARLDRWADDHPLVFR